MFRHYGIINVKRIAIILLLAVTGSVMSCARKGRLVETLPARVPEAAHAMDVAGLTAALEDEDPQVRARAAKSLGELEDPAAVEPLAAALKDKNKDPGSVDPLIDALTDKSSEVRKWSAMALGEIGDKRAAQPLVAALKDKDRGVRTKAAEALGKTGNATAIKPLIDVLGDDCSDCRQVRESAFEALKSLTGKGFSQDPELWKKWWEENH